MSLSLLKTRFERIDDVARQGSDAQQGVLTARSGVCRERPSRAKREFALHYNRWHISQGFVEGALRWMRLNDQCTHVGSTRSSAQHIRSASASGTRWVGPGY